MNMYSPKIYDELIPYIYRVATVEKVNMTKLINRILKAEVLILHDRLIGENFTPHFSERNKPKLKAPLAKSTETKRMEIATGTTSAVYPQPESVELRLAEEVTTPPPADQPTEVKPKKAKASPEPGRKAKRQHKVLKGVKP